MVSCFHGDVCYLSAHKELPNVFFPCHVLGKTTRIKLFICDVIFVFLPSVCRLLLDPEAGYTFINSLWPEAYYVVVGGISLHILSWSLCKHLSDCIALNLRLRVRCFGWTRSWSLICGFAELLWKQSIRNVNRYYFFAYRIKSNEVAVSPWVLGIPFSGEVTRACSPWTAPRETCEGWEAGKMFPGFPGPFSKVRDHFSIVKTSQGQVPKYKGFPKVWEVHFAKVE